MTKTDTDRSMDGLSLNGSAKFSVTYIPYKSYLNYFFLLVVQLHIIVSGFFSLENFQPYFYKIYAERHIAKGS